MMAAVIKKNYTQRERAMLVFPMASHRKFMNVALAVDAIISNGGFCIGKQRAFAAIVSFFFYPIFLIKFTSFSFFAFNAQHNLYTQIIIP